MSLDRLFEHHVAAPARRTQVMYNEMVLTATLDQVHPVQDVEDPQVMTTSYPELATAPVPTMFLMTKLVIGMPLVAVP